MSAQDKKSKDKEKPNPNSYSFFSQVIKRPQSSSSRRREDTAEEIVEIPTLPLVKVVDEVPPVQDKQCPPYQWYGKKELSISPDLEYWWKIKPFPANILEEMQKSSAACYQALTVVHHKPILLLDKIGIILMVGDVEVVEEVSINNKFGCINPLPGRPYTCDIIAQLVLLFLDTSLHKRMGKLEIELTALKPENSYQARVLWIVWREVVLYRAIVRDHFCNILLGRYSAELLEIWLSLAGLDLGGHIIPSKSPVDGLRTLQSMTIVGFNSSHCMMELVRCEAKLLLEKHKSFAWVSDTLLSQLTGISAVDLMWNVVPALDTVVSRISQRMMQLGSDKWSLTEIHLTMSRLIPPPEGLFNGILGMSMRTQPNLHSANISLQGEELAETGKSSGENSYVINFNKIIVTKFEYLLVNYAPEHTTNTPVNWLFSNVSDALKVGDLSSVWITDSGATKHLTGHKEWLTEIKPSNTGVKMAGGHTMQSEVIGKVSLTVVNLDGIKTDITLNDVLYVPGMIVNLFSVTHAVVQGNATVVYDKETMQLRPNQLEGDTLAVGRYVKNKQLFILDCCVNMPEVTEKCFAAREIGSNEYTQLMHKRLLHANAKKMKLMCKAAEGVKQMLHMNAHKCTVCAETKQTKKAVSKAAIPPASKPLERVHIDLVGPFTKSINGNVYACTITDSCTRRKWVNLLKKKSDSYSAFADWAKMVEAKTGLKIKHIRCDSGGEFDSTAFNTWATRCGYTIE